MSQPNEFNFADNSVASAYDSVLVPILFKPWADRLVKEFGPWDGQRVLDLATGTGIVAQQLAGQVGSSGKVLAADISGEMLAIAMQRCADLTPAVEFIECPAQALAIPDATIDSVVCEQGFQFFPDKPAAAQDIYRVMRGGGTLVATIWRPLEECQIIKAVCDALDTIGETDIADNMRIPFASLHGPALAEPFEAAGFVDVQIQRQQQDLILSGIEHAMQVAYATPIGPQLRALPDDRQDLFRKTLTNLLNDLSDDGSTMGYMATSVLSAQKPN